MSSAEIEDLKFMIIALEKRISVIENRYIHSIQKCNKCGDDDQLCDCSICFGCGKAICECD